ncbi:MAG: hypothetical protein U1E27_05640 [Kiritimatiellia bacterium]|nr:hypothetical protein [Kiritimatiellia bacterium]
MKTADAVRHAARRRPIPAPMPSEEFWDRFEDRAQSLRRDAPAVSRVFSGRIWATAAACALILALGIGLFHRTPAPADTIRSLTILTDHAGVIILRGRQHPGTLIWMTQEALTDPGGES